MNFKAFKKKYEKIQVEHYPNEINDNPVVSVCVQTYNHAPYVKECLESILMQETDFHIEILLGEDGSMDGTREICKEYAQKYPDKIRLFLHHRENNIKIGGQPTGRFNLLYNLYSARGKYIALCEGDDYWTDPLKLQKQVNIIEANNYAGVAHNTLVKFEYESLNQSKVYLEKENGDQIFEVDDLIKKRKFHTASFLFNSKYITNIRFPEILSGDRFLFLLIATHGPIYYINEIMCCYRRNTDGISRNVSSDMLKEDLKIPAYLKKIKPDYPVYKSLSFIHYTIVMYSFRISNYDIIKHTFLFTLYSFADFPKNIRKILILFVRGLPAKIKKRNQSK